MVHKGLLLLVILQIVIAIVAVEYVQIVAANIQEHCELPAHD